MQNSSNYESKAARMEIRFPDAAGNPYLTFASMLMAGIDGIKNKIDPGKAFDQTYILFLKMKLKNYLLFVDR